MRLESLMQMSRLHFFPPVVCLYVFKYAPIRIRIHKHLHPPRHSTCSCCNQAAHAHAVAASEEHTLVHTANAMSKPKARQTASRLRVWRML